MANKRMFLQSLVRTDQFLDMPLSAQGIYYNLCMDADDDGFIGSKKRILRMLGALDEDYKCLVDNGYILEFDNGIIVIAHWNLHNSIKKDRYKETVYQTEKSSLIMDCNNVYTKCLRNVSAMYPQDSVDIEEISIDKSSVDKNSSVILSNANDEKKFFGKHKNIPLTLAEYTELQKQFNEIDDALDVVSTLMHSMPDKYKYNEPLFYVKEYIKGYQKSSAIEATPPNTIILTKG